MSIHHVRDDLVLIDLNGTPEGFHQFIGAWLYRRNGVTLLVDPGPASSIAALLENLRELGVQTINYILLTHIHLDHAGGAGQLLQHFPGAKILCHPKGIPHMVAPQKLWEESKKVLGKVAEAYGEMVPVAESRIFFAGTIDFGDLSAEVIETPGHAPHHLSCRIGDVLFAGEVGGVYVPLGIGFHCRPATPPPFRHETFQDSITKLAALDVSLVCLGHYGCRHDVPDVFERARRQLGFWVDTVGRHMNACRNPLEEAILTDLIAHDPDMACFVSLPRDIMARERSFCLNSIRGIREYLRRNRS